MNTQEDLPVATTCTEKGTEATVHPCRAAAGREVVAVGVVTSKYLFFVVISYLGSDLLW